MAAVTFRRDEWEQFCLDNDLPEPDALWYQLYSAGPNQGAERAMDRANRLLGGHGVEAIRAGYYYHVDNYHDDIIATYVNMGDSYAQTLLYDTEQHTFFLTDYAGWLEGWEAEHIPDEPEEPLAPTWEPDEMVTPLIAMLRSVEGYEVAVHLWNSDSMVLAFSVPVRAGEFYASPETLNMRWRRTAGRPSVEERVYKPYTHPWAALQGGMSDTRSRYVCRSGNVEVRLERSQWQRLSIAMDSFMEAGMTHQPVKEFLVAPPVAWTCDELEFSWDQERDNASLWASVKRGDNEFQVWRLTDDALREAIEDGFVKWEDDDSVREYLQELGVCRG